jgi:ADP-ribosylglycohydrolase/predicted enzyme related to lactoylglutathione lyase
MEVVMANKPTGLFKDKAIGAILGAACGDALGWPNERIGRSSYRNQQSQGLLQEFRKWTRRSGGRFYPHEETIDVGEYSDDTQLILCLSRSMLRGEKWWEYWTQIELPFWMLYERGGGGATKRAADAWTNGKTPWGAAQNPKDVKRYFEAGGNGAAMRVLPHILHKAKSSIFEPISCNIFLDGVATHGHPRALVGALAYGYALWKSLRRESRLEYGALVEELLSSINEWSVIPKLSVAQDGWLDAANQNLPNYQKVWDDTVLEMQKALQLCRDELSKGALTFDDEVLRHLQCFDIKFSGAGTVAAAASVFLASRYAPDPMNGIVKAAFSIGSDTDTIASMTGGLLGTICGLEWLSSHRNIIQDSKYLAEVAATLVEDRKEQTYESRLKATSRSLREWLDSVLRSPDGNSIVLPDERRAVVKKHREQQVGRSGKYKVEFRKIITDDGQTLYLSKIVQGSFQSPSEKLEGSIQKHMGDQAKERSCGIKIPVMSFEKAVWFYKDFLGMTIKKQSTDVMVFDNGLMLVPQNYGERLNQGMNLRSIIYVQVTDIEDRLARAEEHSVQIITRLSPWGQSELLFFRCLDPDGNIVEVFSVK